MYKIPLQVLLASCVCVAKKDLRDHFNYVKVQDGYVTATDGHRLLLCDIDGLDKSFDLFIHPDHIKELSKGIINSARFGDVTITIDQTPKGDFAVMTFAQHTVRFPIAYPGKYPDTKRLVQRHTTFVDVMAQFDWQYLAGMQKVAKLLGYVQQVKVKPTGLTTPAVIEFAELKPSTRYEVTNPKYTYNFKAIGVVMPLSI